MMAAESFTSPNFQFTSQPHNPDLSVQDPVYPRQRAIRACQLCRTRRVKCDSKKPSCSACERSGARCIQTRVESTTVLDVGCLKILQRIDDLETVLKSIIQPGATSSVTASTSLVDEPQKLCVTVEKLLSWSVFRGRYDSGRDLKAILRAPPTSQVVTPPAPLDPSFFLSGETESLSSRRLLDRFFDFVHVKNPMLDEPKVRQMVQRLSLEGPAWDAESCLALLVCAIGSIASSFDTSAASQLDAQSIATSESYFSAAQRRIGTIGGNGGILEAQCHFYSGVYLMTRLKPLRAWRCFTQALACCQEFACANPSYPGNSTPSVSIRVVLPAEESVYWSCWKSERELRILLDLPDFSVDDLSYPLLFPTPPEAMAVDQTVSWYFYLSEISLIRLEHRVRDEIKNVLRVDGPSLVDDFAKSTRAVEGLAEEWLRSLPPVMNLFTPQEDDSVLKFILRGHFLNLWEIIYWPWLDIFINRHLRRPEVNLYVAKGLQIGIDRIRINKPGFRHRHHGTWLMVQSCTCSALALLAAKYSPGGAGLLPVGWQEAVSDAIELIRFWQHDAPDALARLRILEELAATTS